MSINWENISNTKPLGEEVGEESYKSSQNLLEKYFEADDHTDIDKIYHRVTLLNSFYSTRMGAERCYSVAEHIQENRELFNKLIFNDDKESKFKLINKLIPTTITYETIDKNKEVKKHIYRPYSFITKYCAIYTWGNHEECLYPIYDSLVRELLKKERKESSNPKIKSILKEYTINEQPENYPDFYNALCEIKKYLNTDFRTLDIFMWREGKKLNQKTTPN